jgi:hypothetical protein
VPCAKARHPDRNLSRDSTLKPEGRRSLKRAIEAFAESTNPNVHRREATKALRAGRLFERWALSGLERVVVALEAQQTSLLLQRRDVDVRRRRSHRAHAEGEHDGTNLNLVPIRKRGWKFDALSLDIRPVPAPQVRHDGLLGCHTDLGMVSRDRGRVDARNLGKPWTFPGTFASFYVS